ncbi:MAG: hypothetical protein K8S87_11240 [Planctomycetes bacterium]|nr:hypothetical protein [Planctomycetota bacterium]
MKIFSIILIAIFVTSCTTTNLYDDNVKAPSIDIDASAKLSDEIIVIDNFYDKNSSSSNTSKEAIADRKKHLKSLLPQGASYTTEYFHFNSDMSYEFTKSWAIYINDAFSELSMLLNPIIKEKSSINVFRTRDRYRNYAKLLAPENVNARGYYDPKFRLIVTFYDDNPEKLKRTLLHECTHLMLRNYLGHNCIPPWLDEGLACTYETGNYVNGKWEFGLPRLSFIRYLKKIMKVREINPFAEVMSMGWRKFIDGTRREVEYRYILSWSLVYFFIYHKNGINKKLFIDFLHKIRGLQEPEMKYSFIYDGFIKPNETRFLSSWKNFLFSLN